MCIRDSTETRNEARNAVIAGSEIETSKATAQGFVNDAVEALNVLSDTPGVLGMRDAATNLLSALDR